MERGRLFLGPIGNAWDVTTADGKRFLMAAPPGRQNAESPITMMLNWPVC